MKKKPLNIHILVLMLILVLFVILSYIADKRMKTGLNYGKKGKRLQYKPGYDKINQKTN